MSLAHQHSVRHWYTDHITTFSNCIYLEDFGISESTLASLTDDHKSAQKSDLSSVQRGLSFTDTIVTSVKPSVKPSVASTVISKPAESVKSLTSSTVTPSVSASITQNVTQVSVSSNDHVPADLLTNANIEVREKKKKGGKKKSNNSNPGVCTIIWIFKY